MLALPTQAPNKALASILGKSNLRFAGMSISVNISIEGLNLSVPATRQVGATRPSPQALGPSWGLQGPQGVQEHLMHTKVGWEAWGWCIT